MQAASSAGCLHTLVLAGNPLGKGGVGYVSWLLQTQGGCIRSIDLQDCAPASCSASSIAAAILVAVELERTCKIPVIGNGHKEGVDVFFVDGVAYDVDGSVMADVMEMREEFKLCLDTLRIGASSISSSSSSSIMEPHGIGSLFKSLARINCLVTLAITSTPIGRPLESNSLDLFMCASLRSLTLDGCCISPAGASGMAQGMLKGACLLQYLSMQSCQLGDIGVGHLECVWEAGVGPATLNISANDIHDRGAMHVSKMIASGCLQALYADDNGIGPTGFTHISEAVCAASSRVQLLHLNNNNATASGASALFRNLALPSPLQLQVQSVQLEDVFVTSRGTRVARELADLQQDHQSSLDDDAAAARIGLEKARERSSKAAAGTATGHGVYKSDVQAHLIGGYDGDGGASGRWSCLECLEMRGNNVGAGCEKDLLEMFKANMTLQVTCACLIPTPHFSAYVFIVAAASSTC